MIFVILMTIAFLPFSFSIFIFYRNYKIFRMRTEIIEKIFDHIDYEWRIEEFHKVSYDQMMLSFRRIRPESFYKDVSFIDGHGKEPTISPFQI